VFLGLKNAENSPFYMLFCVLPKPIFCAFGGYIGQLLARGQVNKWHSISCQFLFCIRNT
jgi:hypothetical protein